MKDISSVQNTRPTILLRSCWAMSNIGDVAITPGMLALLREHLPEARVVVHPAHDGEQTEAYLGERFPEVEWVHGDLGQLHELPPARVLRAYRTADLLLYNSGPILDYGHAVYDGPVRREGWRSFDWNYTMSNALPIYAAVDAGVPWGIFGQEFNYIGPAAQAWSRDLLSRAAFLYARESDSLAYLQSLSVQVPEMGIMPDATFAFDMADDAAADELMTRFGLEPGRFLAMNIRSSAMSFTNQEQERSHMEKLQAVLRAWIDETGLPIFLFPETRPDVEPTRRLVYEATPEPWRSRLRLIDHYWMPGAAFGLFKRAAAMLVMDHHSAILGLAAGIPVIHPRVPMAGRKGWIFRDLGLEDWLFDIDRANADAIIGPLLDAWRRPEAARRRVAEAMQRVRALHRNGMKIVRATMEAAADPGQSTAHLRSLTV